MASDEGDSGDGLRRERQGHGEGGEDGRGRRSSMFKGCGCRGEGCCCGKLGGSGLGGGTGRLSSSTVDILMPAAGEEIWSKVKVAPK